MRRRRSDFATSSGRRLEDPGQTFLEHNDVTPTFQNGRWISDGEGQKRPEQIFTEMEIPTTFLHTAWEATVAAGKWTEDIGESTRTA